MRYIFKRAAPGGVFYSFYYCFSSFRYSLTRRRGTCPYNISTVQHKLDLHSYDNRTRVFCRYLRRRFWRTTAYAIKIYYINGVMWFDGNLFEIVYRHIIHTALPYYNIELLLCQYRAFKTTGSNVTTGGRASGIWSPSGW